VRAGLTVDALLDATRRETPRSEHAARRLVRWFCSDVAG
jgi:hypothetical protein